MGKCQRKHFNCNANLFFDATDRCVGLYGYYSCFCERKNESALEKNTERCRPGRDSSCDNDCAGRDVFVAFTVLAKFFARE